VNLSNQPPIFDHRRQWRDCRYVYPVLSRRSQGLSIGVNLNLNKACNFACLYCQIDRRVSRKDHDVDLDVLAGELRLALEEALDGRLWEEPRFARVAAELRRINDIAFSGDGEPTCLENFDQAVQVAADVRLHLRAEQVKIVVLTNATQLGSPQFDRALPILHAHNGEIWAKLDAGTQAYFLTVNRPRPVVSLDQIVWNITRISLDRPVVIQSLFFKIDGVPPPPEELEAYCGRLKDILAGGGKIKLVQAHTIARSPASASASALADAELDAIADQVRRRVNVPIEVYYGLDVGPQE